MTLATPMQEQLMDTQILLATALLVIALPILGTVLVMVVGLLAALRRRTGVDAVVARAGWVDPLMTRMRLAAWRLGSWLEDGSSPAPRQREGASAMPPGRAAAGAATSANRCGPERRLGDRRQQTRRRYPRLGKDRRDEDRRGRTSAAHRNDPVAAWGGC